MQKSHAVDGTKAYLSAGMPWNSMEEANKQIKERKEQ